MKPGAMHIICALAISTAAVLTGYWALGIWTATIFAVGYFGGFLLWLALPTAVPYARIRWPFWLTLAAFLILHKTEERASGFFDVLAELSGTTVPSATDPAVIAMLVAGFAPWLLIPWWVSRGRGLGYYLAWTFFASMGFSELAHFVLPLLSKQAYGYFPGMISVLPLAPLAWWGMWRLAPRHAKDVR